MIEIPESMARRQLARDRIILEESLGIDPPLVPQAQGVLAQIIEEIRPYLPKSHRDYKPVYP